MSFSTKDDNDFFTKVYDLFYCVVEKLCSCADLNAQFNEIRNKYDACRQRNTSTQQCHGIAKSGYQCRKKTFYSYCDKHDKDDFATWFHEAEGQDDPVYNEVIDALYSSRTDGLQTRNANAAKVLAQYPTRNQRTIRRMWKQHRNLFLPMFFRMAPFTEKQTSLRLYLHDNVIVSNQICRACGVIVAKNSRQKTIVTMDGCGRTVWLLSLAATCARKTIKIKLVDISPSVVAFHKSVFGRCNGISVVYGDITTIEYSQTSFIYANFCGVSESFYGLCKFIRRVCTSLTPYAISFSSGRGATNQQYAKRIHSIIDHECKALIVDRLSSRRSTAHYKSFLTSHLIGRGGFDTFIYC